MSNIEKLKQEIAERMLSTLRTFPVPGTDNGEVAVRIAMNGMEQAYKIGLNSKELESDTQRDAENFRQIKLAVQGIVDSFNK